MEDKIIMDTSLTIVKNACDLLMHGTIESSTKNIKSTFQTYLDKYLTLQGDIYKTMEEGGLYTVETVPESKIKKCCDKHPNTL